MNSEATKLLSKRELKVLALIALGYSSQQIGEALTITKNTVQTHRRNMLQKTGFNNTQQLVGWGYRERLLIVGSEL